MEVVVKISLQFQVFSFSLFLLFRLLSQDLLPFVSCGNRDISSQELNYLTGSLFDPVCPENLGKRGSYILDQEKHHESFGERHGMARFGAFWSDYVFTMVQLEEDNGEL